MGKQPWGPPSDEAGHKCIMFLSRRVYHYRDLFMSGAVKRETVAWHWINTTIRLGFPPIKFFLPIYVKQSIRSKKLIWIFSRYLCFCPILLYNSPRVSTDTPRVDVNAKFQPQKRFHGVGGKGKLTKIVN